MEAGIGGDREINHGRAVSDGWQVVVGFVRSAIARNPEYSVDLGLLLGLLRKLKVPSMGWIEGAAKDGATVGGRNQW